MTMLWLEQFIDWLRSLLSCLLTFLFQKTVRFSSGRSVQVGEVLREGAFSFVYKARSCETGEVFALKKLYIQSPELQRSAETEIDALKKFRHENIIKMVDYTFANESGKGQIALILLPYTPGGSLRDVINHQLKLPLNSKPRLASVLSQFLEVCRALNVLHTYAPAYVHRDIKPENILFSDKGRPLLIDFGSVAPADVPVNTRQEALRIADEAAQFCTVSYRSPELFEPTVGVKHDSRTDVWAMGCLLFAWFYGYSPFESEFTDAGTLRVVECSHLRVLGRPSRHPRPSTDDVVVAKLVDWILEKDIRSRPFTCDIIARIEETLRSGESDGRV